MLRKTRELKGARLAARGGEIGHVKDFYFDDQLWVVRYLVADTGNWLPHRKVLISPHAVTGFHTTPHHAIEVNLSRQQIEESPSIDQHLPVSRRMEARIYQHYGWPYYWPGPFAWGPLAFPAPDVADTMPVPAAEPPPPQPSEDSHLRSTSEVQGYSIQALDRDFGHVEDFILDDMDWGIRYLVADTRKWWPGKRVLLSPQWIASVSWPELSVYIDLDRDTVKRAPEYDPGTPITREYEQKLFDHYSRPPYWEMQPAPPRPG